MTDEIPAEQTLGSLNPEVEKDTVKEQVAKTFTQEELDQKIKDRLDRERKKYANYSDLEAKAKKLEEIEAAKLNDEEKAAKRLKELEDKIAEKERELEERALRDLKRSKIEQAIADGKMEMPKGKTIDSLVKRCLGTNEDEITSDVEELIGFFPKAEPPKGQGIGTQVDTGSTKQNKTLDDEIAELKMALASPPIGLSVVDLRNYKEQTAKRLLALNNRKMMNFSRS
jgi:flagellar biosynthesis GTPase FlhF